MKKVYWYYIFCLVVLSACSNQTSDVIEVSKIQKMDVNDSEPSEGEDEEFVLMETYNESVRSNTDIIADFCISEATGIAGGVSLVGAMAAGTMTKKQLLKVLGMIGGKTALRVSCGVGLALIAAEIAWCMY